MKTITERFLSYIQFDTQADETSTQTPSSKGQTIFAEMLEKELLSFGLEVHRTEKSYVYAKLASTLPGKKIPAIAFVAHMDTSPAMSGKNIAPRIVANYDGNDIQLNENTTLSPNQYPEIRQYIGQDIIVTDGTTLLGSDDKAGVAAIVTAIQEICELDNFKHGDIFFAFTPDEEIGRGADYFDLQFCPADWAYTIDGGEIGELEFENFNAASATITILGNSVHPGYAKNKMLNSQLVAQDIISALSEHGLPENTTNYEGFFHLDKMEGNVEKTTLQYIIRDFDAGNFTKRKGILEEIVTKTQYNFPHGKIEFEITDQYYNMRTKIEPMMHIVDIAKKAMQEVGVTPLIKPIRGGTDGARLSYMGLPCPNIFAGGHNFHSKFEYVPIPSMEKSMQTVLKIIQIVTR
ncbi:MAG: peptidase T [Paludibacteraceae bacterium]|nr:peptidase T [Paludibacteraceae bacterium]MBP6284026.1 peptidase T [Paludibacteraceae bacterium]